MNHWSFVIAAYVITLGLTGVLLLLSWRWMRRAEAQAESAARR
ncbi:heme exporter protein CcmD [Sphingomonas sp. HDW15A]|nr:heme exporter protein CcmD [Sphingomonas sp. HDW15A]QIK96018.1 heme exporter protein CcmD [Sphingomonas sp. HDW15A]